MSRTPASRLALRPAFALLSLVLAVAGLSYVLVHPPAVGAVPPPPAMTGCATPSFGAANFAAGTSPWFVAVGDLNGDGKPDLAAANFSSGDVTVLLNNCTANQSPTITDLPNSRQAGGPISSSQIATVNDNESGPAGVNVTVTGANPSNGVTVSNLVNNSGNVTADVVADCTATDASFTLTATDGDGGTATATLTVTANTNTAPALGTYSNTSVATGGSTTVTPSAAPSDNGSISSSTAAAPGFTGSLSVDAAGIVSIGNAGPAGNHVVTVTLTDNCGVQTVRTFNLSVTTQFNFAGFFAPVDNLPTLNVATAGSAIPVKFGPGGNQGLNIFAPGYPASSQIACDAHAPGDEIEQTVNAGGSSLSYDQTTDRYSYIWKTDKAWKGTCRPLVVRLSDGTDHFAKFRFK